MTAVTQDNNTDTKPWYRHFWFWFIFAPLGIWCIAMTATMVLLTGQMDEVVTGDYKKMGKVYTQTANGEAMAVNGRLQLQRDIGRVSIALTGLDQAPERVRLTLQHPTAAQDTIKVELKRDGAGVYRGPLPRGVEGARFVRIQPLQGDWQLTAELAEGASELSLTTAGAPNGQ